MINHPNLIILKDLENILITFEMISLEFDRDKIWLNKYYFVSSLVIVERIPTNVF